MPVGHPGGARNAILQRRDPSEIDQTARESEELEEEEAEGYTRVYVWGRSVKFHFTLPSAATDGARYGSADTYVANAELVSTP